MHRRLLLWLTVSALLALVCLSGCAQILASRQAATVGPPFSSLQVLRTSDFPQNHIPPFATTVTDAAKTGRLYEAIEALPAYPTGNMLCSVDWGVSYHLAFHSTTSSVPQVNIDAGGCRGVSFGGARSKPQKQASSPQFWQLFTETLGVSASTLSVSPQSTGPSAPTPSP
jgi:hypothetical protein